MQYKIEIKSTDKKFDAFMVKCFVSCTDLKSIVKRGVLKGYRKTTMVQTFKALCRLYGYSGIVPLLPRERPAGNWSTINGVEYCSESKRYWFKGSLYCEGSARHNGIIGYGVVFKSIINEVTS